MMGFLVFLAVFVDPVTVDFIRGYAPDHFIINAKTRLAQDVWNSTYPRSVEAIGDEGMSLASDCRAVLSCPKCTQYVFECTPTLHGNGFFRIRFRTTATDYKSTANYGLAIEFSNGGANIFESGRHVAHIDSVDLTNNSERIVIENYAGDYTIVKGCNRLYRGHTTLPNTDGLVFETSDSSSAEVRYIIRNSAFDDLDWKR